MMWGWNIGLKYNFEEIFLATFHHLNVLDNSIFKQAFFIFTLFIQVDI